MLFKICVLCLALACGLGQAQENQAQENQARENASGDDTASKLVWTEVSSNGVFEVTLDPQTDEPIEINQFLEWILTIKTPDGDVVSPARVTVGGGMPMHGHGLPSQPQVSDYQGDGRYVVKGLMFSMKGRWAIDLNIQSKSLSDKVSFEIKLDY